MFHSSIKRIAAAFLCLSFTLSACSHGSADTANTAHNTVKTSQAPRQKLAPAASVKDGETDINPKEIISVTSRGDGLKKVTMTNENGKVVAAQLSDDKKEWKSAEPLGYGRTYTIAAVDNNGKELHTSFSTVSPYDTVALSMTPLPDSVVGVGQTINFVFGYDVANRKAVQDAIKITTEPKVEGAFYWIASNELRWRPREFWAPGTKVHVAADLYGVNIGDDIYGTADVTNNFTIGDRVEAIADDNTKTMTVYKNGELLRSIPISMGSSQWPTPNGVYMIGDLNPEMVMDSTTYGLSLEAGGYKTKVKYASQMSYDGIYVHAAPWSVWAQGVQNTSHGCINVSTDNAQWFQGLVKRGDIVTVKNTIGGFMSGYDGLGSWNIPWETWKAGNAQPNNAQ
ncbi:Ig-like domain-containing protein [Corynebacterium sp. sy039]|uniref:L,D-transpeptidase n=1 Tax=Corynebacterium sp. sy039 TaxID=2599641 RepID=UPI00143CEE8F|nr:Ig-like domain-containing protein [Corynebacterium sp. sy039]